MADPPLSPQPVELVVRAGRVIGWCVGGWALLGIALVVLDYHFDYRERIDIHGLRYLADMANRRGLAQWFAEVQSFLLALTAWGLWLVVRRAGWNRAAVWGWLLLAVSLSVLAVDRGADLRQVLGAVLDDPGHGTHPPFPFWPAAAWQAVLFPMLAVGWTAALLFLRSQLGRLGVTGPLLVVAFCFVSAALLDLTLELPTDHRHNGLTGIVERYDLSAFSESRFGKPPERMVRHFAKVGREYLGLLGGTILWFLLLRHAALVAHVFTIRYVDRSARPDR